MLRKNIGNIVALLFLLFLVLYILLNKELFLPLTEIAPIFILLISIVKVTQIFVSGLFTKFTLNAFKKDITYKESAYIAMISSLGNYFGPILGGAGVRAAYLRKKHDFALTHFAGALYGYYLVSFFASSFVGLVALGFVYMQTGSVSFVVTFVLLGIAITTGSLFFIKLPKSQKLTENKIFGKFYKRAIQVNQGWEILVYNKKLFRRMLYLGFVMLLIGIITSYLEFVALGITFSMSVLVLYSVLGTLTLIISFTPGAIGVRETVYLFTSSLLMLTNQEILQLAALDRGITLIILTIAYLFLQFFKKK